MRYQTRPLGRSNLQVISPSYTTPIPYHGIVGDDNLSSNDSRTLHANTELSYRYIASLRKVLSSEGMFCVFDTAPEEIQAREIEMSEPEMLLPPAQAPFELIEIPMLTNRNRGKATLLSKSVYPGSSSGSKDTTMSPVMKPVREPSQDTQVLPPGERFLLPKRDSTRPLSVSANVGVPLKTSEASSEERSIPIMHEHHPAKPIKLSKYPRAYQNFPEISASQPPMTSESSNVMSHAFAPSTASTPVPIPGRRSTTVPPKKHGPLPSIPGNGKSMTRQPSLTSLHSTSSSTSNYSSSMIPPSSSLKVYGSSVKSGGVPPPHRMPNAPPSQPPVGMPTSRHPGPSSIGMKRSRPESIIPGVPQRVTKRPTTPVHFIPSTMRLPGATESHIYDRSGKTRIQGSSLMTGIHPSSLPSTLSQPSFEMPAHQLHVHNHPSTTTQPTTVVPANLGTSFTHGQPFREAPTQRYRGSTASRFSNQPKTKPFGSKQTPSAPSSSFLPQ